MTEFILFAIGLLALFLVIIMVIVDHQWRDEEDAFPMTRKREKARMMREEWSDD